MRRREALKLAAMGMAAAATEGWSAAASGIRAIDAHIHLFNPLRPSGVPWPEKSDAVLYQPALPARYLAEAAGFGVVGAIAVECSPLRIDNLWLLNLAAHHVEMVGVIGNLDPAAAEFGADLEQLRQDPLFLGFRYGNLWGRDLAADLDKPGFVEGLKALAAAGLTFESANPDARLIGALRRVVDAVPNLRVVVDHLPHAVVPRERAAEQAWWADLRALAASPEVYIKLSEIPRRADGQLVVAVEAYREGLDALYATFGEDKVIFGSDWPNSDHVATYAETFAVVRSYMAMRSWVEQVKYYWRNSAKAYRWRPRTASQPAS